MLSQPHQRESRLLRTALNTQSSRTGLLPIALLIKVLRCLILYTARWLPPAKKPLSPSVRRRSSRARWSKRLTLGTCKPRTTRTGTSWPSTTSPSHSTLLSNPGYRTRKLTRDQEVGHEADHRRAPRALRATDGSETAPLATTGPVLLAPRFRPHP